MELLSPPALALVAVLVGGAAAAGWFAHRMGEQMRRQAFDADHRESLRAAGVARDRAREEAKEIERRFQAFREDHQTCDSAIQELKGKIGKLEGEIVKRDARLASLDAKLDSERGGAAELKQEHDVARTRVRKLEQQIEVDVARLEQRLAECSKDLARTQERLIAEQEARAESAEQVRRLDAQVNELEQSLVDKEHAFNNGAPDWLLARPRRGKKDDLTAIRGLGPVLERALNSVGIFHYAQLARLNAEHIDWLASRVNVFPGKIKKDDWPGQARQLQTKHPRK